MRWIPDRPVSKGAEAYHEAVSRAEYYIAILDELMKMAAPKIKNNEVVIDFGAGTGVSALRLQEVMQADANLWLVDNSPAWLGKAYDVLKSKKNVDFFLLNKTIEGYEGLGDTIGVEIADHVISANTVHLIPDLDEAFIGVNEALKQRGDFIFESGNITRSDRPEGALMVDNTVKKVHDIALDIIRKDIKFSKYKKGLDEKIKATELQRKFIFPDPRPIEFYLRCLEKAGFDHGQPEFKHFKVKYDDWLNFLRVRRLQAGILPEIGGNEATAEEESDRDLLITLATNMLFDELKNENKLADKEGFIIEVAYVMATKAGNVANPRKPLKGKTALVTGASRGIGRAIAIDLAKNGANIIANYNKNEAEANEIVEQLKHRVNCISVKADVGNLDSVQKMAYVVKEKFGQIDILVNNAGMIIDRTLQNMQPDEWNLVINNNLNSVYNVTKSMLPLMRENGRVVNISSIVGLQGNFGQANYSASKAAMIGFTKSLAKEVSRKKITVNAIAPGLIETDILKSIPADRKKKMAEGIPLGRAGTPEDVAYLVSFLASDKASYITGEAICIDGGFRF